jgi:hypothetical protein
MGVRDITGAAWAVAAATTAALLWSLLDTPPSWDVRIFVNGSVAVTLTGCKGDPDPIRVRIQSGYRVLMTKN